MSSEYRLCGVLLLRIAWDNGQQEVPVDERKAFGARLRALRKKAGLTQLDLGTEAEVDYKYLGQLENGNGNPTLAVVCKLAAALGVEGADLLTYEHVSDDPAELRTRLDALLRDADVEDLQRAVKLLHAILR